jgi:hypothetical protein
MLRELKMHGMAHAVAELAEQGAPAFEAAQPVLSQLLKAETAEREVRSVAVECSKHSLIKVVNVSHRSISPMEELHSVTLSSVFS